jgi:hypothetical protein
MSDVRLLRDKNLFVITDEAVAFVTPWGWQALPDALAAVVRDALRLKRNRPNVVRIIRLPEEDFWAAKKISARPVR